MIEPPTISLTVNGAGRDCQSRRCEQRHSDVLWLPVAIPEVTNMFPTPHSTSLFAGQGRARALQTWREAATLVATRWQNFLDAERESRAFAFASYVAALDAEEAAAAEMAALMSSLAA